MILVSIFQKEYSKFTKRAKNPLCWNKMFIEIIISIRVIIIKIILVKLKFSFHHLGCLHPPLL